MSRIIQVEVPSDFPFPAMIDQLFEDVCTLASDNMFAARKMIFMEDKSSIEITVRVGNLLTSL